MPTSDPITERLRQVMSAPPAPPADFSVRDPFARQRIVDQIIGSDALIPSGLPRIAPPRVGLLPGQPSLPAELAPAVPSDFQQRTEAAHYGGTLPQAWSQQNAEMLRDAEQLYSTSIPQIASGVAALPKHPLYGAGEIARGTMKAALPLAIGGAIAAPIPAAIGLGVGTSAGSTSSWVASKLGASPETAQNVGDVIGLLSGVLSGIYSGMEGFGAARSAAELNRGAELAMAKIPEATPQQAAVLRAQAAALTKAAGDVAPEQIGIGGVIPKTGEPPKWSPEAGKLILPDLKASVQGFNDRWVDAGLPILRMEKAGGVTGDASAYQAFRGFAGNPGRMELMTLREPRRILYPIERQGLMPDLNRYFELQRHEENFLKKGPLYKTPGNMDLTQVRVELSNMADRLGPKLADVDRAAQQLRDLSDRALADFRDSGMISPAQETAMTTPGHKYAPLQRAEFVPDDTEHIPVGGRSFNVRNQPVVKELKGSELEIVPPVKGFLWNIANMTYLADKNRVTSKIGDMAQDPVFEGVVRPLKASQKPGKGEGAITTFRNGVKESYAVPKPVADVIGGMTVSDADLMVRWAKKTRFFNRVMIEGSTTYNLPFQTGNLIRDYKTATLKSAEAGYVFTPVDWLKGFWSSVKQDDFFDKYLNSGGAFSGFFERQSGTKGTLDRVLEPKWKQYGRDVLPWNLAHTVSSKIEQAPRVGFFRMLNEADQSGNPGLLNRLSGEGSIKRSQRTIGFMSRNATTDFARSGSDMRQLNLWVPMLNARKEGLVNSLSAFKNSPVKSALVLNAFAIPTVLSYLHNATKHPDTLRDLSQQYKNNYDFWITGDEKNEEDGAYPNVWGVRKDDLWAAYSNLLVDSLQRFRGENPQEFSRMVTQMLSDTLPFRLADEGHLSLPQFSSSVLPTLAKAVIEKLANRNLSSGRVIENTQEQGGHAQKRYNNETPGWVVATSKAIPEDLNISPKQIQNFMSTQFGAAGRMASSDVRPGRTPWMERTGVGPLIRTFSGAPGRGLERKDFDASKEISKTVVDESLDREREAKRLLQATKDLPPEQRVGVLQGSYRNGKLDLPTFEKYINLVEDWAGKVSPFERWLRAQPAEAKAQIIIQKIDKAPQTAGTLIQRYDDVGVLTDSVAEEMANVFEKRGYGIATAQKTKDQEVEEALRRAMRGGK